MITRDVRMSTNRGRIIMDCPMCDGHGSVEVNDAQTFETMRAMEIIKDAADGEGVTLADVAGPVRSHLFCLARENAAWRMRSELGMGLKAIGWHLGKRDHSTVINMLRNYEKRRQLDD